MNIEYRWELINALIQKHDYTSYLEIGYDIGTNFNQVNCKKKESIDPCLGYYDCAKPTYKMTSDEFFSLTKNTYDIIFVDGLHHSEQVDKDIENSLKILSSGGSVIIHDCNPQSKASQEVPRQIRQWNGDVWKSIVRYRQRGNLGVCVLDTDEGLGIISSNICKVPIPFPIPFDLTYEFLDSRRKELLNLKPITITSII